MPIIEESQTIDPLDMFVVRYVRGSVTKRRVAFGLAYVVVELSSGKAGIALEVLYDPEHQSPTRRYRCTSYQQTLVSPKLLKSVSPYMP